MRTSSQVFQGSLAYALARPGSTDLPTSKEPAVTVQPGMDGPRCFWMCGKQRTWAGLLAEGPVLRRKRTS